MIVFQAARAPARVPPWATAAVEDQQVIIDPVKSLDDYLILAAEQHKHLCAGQVLGVRLAMLGLRSIGIEDPENCQKRLLTFVEIDRCATDAISIVTGCRLGRRSMKYLDYGKVAATFCDLETNRAARVSARDDSRLRAKALFPELASPKRQQFEAYKVMSEAELFGVRRVRVKLRAEDLPGHPRSRVNCEKCGEGINDGREVLADGGVVCRACAGDCYYEVLEPGVNG